MLNYELMINDKRFSGEIDYERPSDNYIQLEMLLKAAPVYYLYKFNDSEDLEKFITPYTALSLIGASGLNDLIELNRLIPEIRIGKNDNKENNHILLDFITLCVEEIIVTDDFNRERILDQIGKLNLNRFQQQRRIYNYINEITGACFNLKDNGKKTKAFERYISDKIISILKVASPKIYDFINKYKKIDSKENSYYLSCFFSGNPKKKEALSDTISNNIKSVLSLLSITPSSNKQYLKQLKAMKSICVQQLPKYMEHDRCFAIAQNNDSIYFSFSGLWDVDGDFKKGIDVIAKKINHDLFDDKAKWCILTPDVLNYVDIKSPNNQDECIYINPPEYYPGEDARFFSCCERKILAQQQDLTKYNLFVMFSPCYKCAKPLYENYKSITCLLNYEDDERKKKYKDNLFNPKKYKVEKKDNHYKVIEIH